MESHDKSVENGGWLRMLVVAIAAATIGLFAGYGSAMASPASQDIDLLTTPSDGEVDPMCWSCPRRIHPIIIYACATPVGGPTVAAPPGVPTLAPPPTPTPGGAAGTLTYRVCPQTTGNIPPSVEVHAIAAPWEIYGYGMLRNPNVPYHPMWNTYRTWLSLRNTSVPHSRCNPVVWKAGCP